MLNLSKRLFLTCLFTDGVLQSVDRSQGKDSVNSKRQHAFEAIEEAPEEDGGTHMIEDDNEGDYPYVDEEGNFSRTKMSCLTLTMTWPSMTRTITKHFSACAMHEIS